MESLQHLEGVIKNRLKNRLLVIASNTAPYVHFFQKDKVQHRIGTGGVVSALNAVLEASGGTWVAASQGDADSEAMDKDGFISVPPKKPAYRFRPLFLSKGDTNGYLHGVSNAAIVPWAHNAYVRPRFEEAWWKSYEKVNRQFADAIIKSIGDQDGFVWIQDYQLSLCSQYVKEKRPDLVVAQFWHVPWPNADVFKVNPWGEHILKGLLHNDLLGFHVPQYGFNFVDAVDQTLPARIDRESNTIHYQKGQTVIRHFPISIHYQGIHQEAKSIRPPALNQIRKNLGGTSQRFLVGLERFDYTKGLIEKFRGFDRFLEKNPEYQGKVTLVQVASPTREAVKEYRDYADDVVRVIEEINWKYEMGRWQPIILLHEFVSRQMLLSLYRLADACLVTSLHEGMNLVAKEYVTSKTDGDGVLILSKFTGAARELKSALLINPFSTHEISDAIKQAMEMPKAERMERMHQMQTYIREHDVFQWAADMLESISRLESSSPISSQK
ncbi:trehalose-6-phosphate synthase [Candidatus Micrarchaeota archaeon]|nr:trehalose-6-phosphate synthase [Candidatus Micrarchaeota archaeon]